jgi:hypothetical protein
VEGTDQIAASRSLAVTPDLAARLRRRRFFRLLGIGAVWLLRLIAAMGKSVAFAYFLRLLQSVLLGLWPDLNHAALRQELGCLLRRLELPDVVPTVRVIRCPFEHCEHLFLYQPFRGCQLFDHASICKCVSNVSAQARSSSPVCPVRLTGAAAIDIGATDRHQAGHDPLEAFANGSYPEGKLRA